MFENIANFLKKLFKIGNQEENSSASAKERLHLVLMQDRANVSADFLEMMKQEIIEVIKKYIEVDENAIDVNLSNKMNDDGTNAAPALYANIPIISIKENTKKIETELANKKEDEVKEEKIEEEIEEVPKKDVEDSKREEKVEEEKQEELEKTEVEEKELSDEELDKDEDIVTIDDIEKKEIEDKKKEEEEKAEPEPKKKTTAKKTTTKKSTTKKTSTKSSTKK